MNSQAAGRLFTNIFVLLIGLILTAPPLYKTITYVTNMRQSISVQGEVVKRGQGAYMGSKPFIAFVDSTGERHIIKSKISYHWFFAPKMGDKIKILYRKDAPQDAKVASRLHYFFIPFLFISIGLLMIFSVLLNRIK